VDTPLHSLYVSSRPLDKGIKEDMIIIFRYLSVACIPIHTHTHTHTHIQMDLNTLYVRTYIWALGVCVCVCVCVRARVYNGEKSKRLKSKECSES